MSLTNKEVQQLFVMDKFPAKKASIDFPLNGDKVIVDLVNDTGRIQFQADVNRVGRIANKTTYQFRHNKVNRIRRLDILGDHRNPPGPAPDPIFLGYEEYLFLAEDHLHFYIEGFNDRWALPLSVIPELDILEADELYVKLAKFFNYCNIEDLEIVYHPTLF